MMRHTWRKTLAPEASWVPRGCAAFVLTLLSAVSALGQLRLELGTAVGVVGDDLRAPLTLSTDRQVEALTAVLGWDPSKVQGQDLMLGAAIAEADFVARRVQQGFMVLEVIMDTDASDGLKTIPAGDDQEVLTAILGCLEEEFEGPLNFLDGEHSLLPRGLPVDNQVVVAGRRIEADGGLLLGGGSFSCSSKDIDSDGDGVENRKDLCPRLFGDTPTGCRASSTLAEKWS